MSQTDRTQLFDRWAETHDAAVPSANGDFPFDGYDLHEFDLATKISLLRRVVSHHLAAGGCILVADIAFPTALAREEAAQRWAVSWDEDETCWVADETIAACEEAWLQATYKQVSSCGGVFTFARRPQSHEEIE